MRADSKSTRWGQGFPRHPLYVGLFTAFVVLAADFPIHAQQVPAVSVAPQQYNIAAGQLGDALNQLAIQSHLHIVYAPELVQGKTTLAVNGRLTWHQALEKLLAGSGLEWRLVDHNLVAIRKAAPPTGTSPGASSTTQRAEPTRNRTSARTTTALKGVTVLGSLIPRSQIETASPLIVITADDIKNRGFSSVADALQNATVSTGAVNNTTINTGDIWAAKTIGLFGLDPSYTKFLIDGRPMPLYSQMASTGTVDQLYTNLNGIPIDMVDRIEILPGGQSSLYGSDAVAGVVNIVLKKHVNAASIDARIGSYSDGGGRERMFSATDQFNVGKLSVMAGIQVNDQQPMWAFQRGITAQNFAGGITPQTPSEVAVVGGFSGKTYFPTSQADCAKLASLWGGSVAYISNPYGAYCGSNRSGGYTTLMTKSQQASMNLHASYAVNDQLQLYGDLLDSYDKQSHEVLNNFFTLLYDPNLRDTVYISRAFAPEEIANNLDGLLTQTDYENTYTATVGGKYDFGNGWDLDVGFTRAAENLDDRQIGMLGNNVPGSYGTSVLGPQLGTEFGYPVYAPNYSLLENPLTPAQFASYLGAASIASSDSNDQLRAQLTQTSLFSLPGGDAGLALVAEEGNESWKYQPSPLLSNGYLQGLTWNSSGGHRTRYATAAELNLPLFKMLTADLSARYDSYDAEGAHFSHPTYSVGLEFRPFSSLLLRAKYTTSFKAPSLIDEFEGGSSAVRYVTDWVNCARLGYSGAQLGNCPIQYRYVPATIAQTSNPGLQPMTARTLSYGAVWAPTANLSMSLDYQHISIHNEVLMEDPNYLAQIALYCSDGTLDPQSPSCLAVNSQITRAPAAPGSPLLGTILSETTTKINIASEVDNAVNASFDYKTDPYAWGWLRFNLAYTRVLTHRQETFPGDPVEDLLRDPGYGTSTQFPDKANASLTWSRQQWSVTLYESYSGPTPNEAARLANNYTSPNTGKIPPWRIYNASVNYSPTPAWQLSLRVNNIKNSMPFADPTEFGSFNQPFYPGNYNPYGREVFLEARYSFGHEGAH